MEPFKTFRGIAAPLDRANVDTDQIIAKQFLKSIKRTGFGESLFNDWRFLPDGKPDASFVLNDPKLKGASILVARNNFGCGSSREHAVWAVAQYGFKAVIAPSMVNGDSVVPAFADIFRNNCSKNGLLTVELKSEEVQQIFDAAKTAVVELTMDLVNQKVVLHGAADKTFSFQIDSAVKERLVKGLDDIGTTLQESASISAFEQKHETYLG
ncbi:MAG TPA: 3-isopropylmalate dehydratase small subunit [Candidatus Omnitrophota bacterium]|nr:3-isopropylmalate dehydratase small subunit [Candidatus Omnitrophota bacterium]